MPASAAASSPLTRRIEIDDAVHPLLPSDSERQRQGADLSQASPPNQAVGPEPSTTFLRGIRHVSLQNVLTSSENQSREVERARQGDMSLIHRSGGPWFDRRLASAIRSVNGSRRAGGSAVKWRSGRQTQEERSAADAGRHPRSRDGGILHPWPRRRARRSDRQRTRTSKRMIYYYFRQQGSALSRRPRAVPIARSARWRPTWSLRTCPRKRHFGTLIATTFDHDEANPDFVPSGQHRKHSSRRAHAALRCDPRPQRLGDPDDRRDPSSAALATGPSAARPTRSTCTC